MQQTNNQMRSKAAVNRDKNHGGKEKHYEWNKHWFSEYTYLVG